VRQKTKTTTTTTTQKQLRGNSFKFAKI
jgi:hypothetical protein